MNFQFLVQIAIDLGFSMCQYVPLVCNSLQACEEEGILCSSGRMHINSERGQELHPFPAFQLLSPSHQTV